MAIKVASWNIEGRLSPIAKSGRGSSRHIVEEIARLNADVVFLPEATINGGVEPGVDEALKDQGYLIYESSYDDAGSRPHDQDTSPTMRFLSRLAISESKQLRYGDMRTMLSVTVEDPDSQSAIQLFGIHLDDRSEQNRLTQLPELVAAVQNSHAAPLLLGDFNAMHAQDIRARILRNRITRQAIRVMSFGLTGYTLRRLSEMAEGTALKMLQEQTGLSDVDPSRRATVTPKSRDNPSYPSFRMVQIDHILAGEGVRVEDFMVHQDAGSDHRALSATLYVA